MKLISPHDADFNMNGVAPILQTKNTEFYRKEMFPEETEEKKA